MFEKNCEESVCVRVNNFATNKKTLQLYTEALIQFFM